MWSRGFAADETKTAFARAGEFAGQAGDAPARLVAYYAQCLRGMVRGEYGQAREIAELGIPFIAPLSGSRWNPVA